jgi:hypothetical protein
MYPPGEKKGGIPLELSSGNNFMDDETVYSLLQWISHDVDGQMVRFPAIKSGVCVMIIWQKRVMVNPLW